MQESLIDFTKYNIWANQRMISLCQQYIELIELPIKSSFSTIRETLKHNLFAEHIWLERLKGNKSPIVKRDFDGKIEELFEAIIIQSKEWHEFIKSSTDAFLAKNCNYQTTSGESFSEKNGELTLHVMNHSSYHRGQITTMLRVLGATELISVDYITYLRE